MRTPTILLIAFCLLAPGASEAKKRKTGKGPCTEASQCRQDVCVEINGSSYCSKSCGRCPAGMYCDANLFQMLGLKVCLKGKAKAPVKPETPPRLPCKNDDECSGALVCAQKHGQRDCTLECTKHPECEMPEMLGVKFDFLECALDEGTRGRKACLPKDACLKNPMSCMQVNTATMAEMTGQLGNMIQGVEAAAEAADPGHPTEPAEPTASASAMSASRFNALLEQVKDASFWDEREAILQTAAKHNHFNCDQIGRLMKALSFGDERVGTVRILAPKLVDPENGHTILKHLDFDDEKKKVREILNR